MRNKMASDSSQHDEDDTEILQFNLTNPDQLTKQLAAAKLDDGETDALLKEAMRINNQLKETLRLQQLEETSEDETAGSRKHPSGPSEPAAPRNPKQSILPPITHSGRSACGSSGGGSRQRQRDSKTKSLKDPQRLGSGSRHKGTPSEHKVKRPAWDDRFFLK